MSEAIFDYTQKAAHIIKANKKIVDHLLSLNRNNRSIKKCHLKWILDAIEKKEFVLTGQGIGISVDGDLIDGQHRLTAIREAGYPPVEILVVTGIDPRARIYIDQNAKRSTADMLKIVMDKNITTRMAAVLRFHMNLEEFDNNFLITKKKNNLEEFISQMAQHGEWIADILSTTKGTGKADAICAIFHYAQKFSYEDAMEFSSEIGTGANLSLNDPALKIREWCLKNKNNGQNGLAYRMMVTACIAHATARELGSLRPSASWANLPKRAMVRVLPSSQAKGKNTVAEDKAAHNVA